MAFHTPGPSPSSDSALLQAQAMVLQAHEETKHWQGATVLSRLHNNNAKWCRLSQKQSLH